MCTFSHWVYNAAEIFDTLRYQCPSVAVWDLGMMPLEQPTYSQSFERLFAGSLDNFRDSGEKIRAAAINIKEKGVQLQDTKPDVPHVLRAVVAAIVHDAPNISQVDGYVGDDLRRL
jgi:hypothetical protein